MQDLLRIKYVAPRITLVFDRSVTSEWLALPDFLSAQLSTLSGQLKPGQIVDLVSEAHFFIGSVYIIGFHPTTDAVVFEWLTLRSLQAQSIQPQAEAADQEATDA